MQLSKRSAIVVAGLLSFAVYFLPLWTVHATFMVGPALLYAVQESDELSLHLALNLVAAVALQGLLAGVLYVFLRRVTIWRGALLLLSLPVLAVLGQVTYLLAIPWFTLVERVNAPEQADWPVACRVENVGLHTVFQNADVALERAGVTWTAQIGSEPGERVFSLLSMPDCRLQERLRVTKFRGTSASGFGPDGGILYWTYGSDMNDTAPWVLGVDETTPQSQDVPPDVRHWSPVLSRDSSAVAWLEPQGGAVYRTVIRDLASGAERAFELALEPGHSLELLAFDRNAGALMLRTGRDRALVVDLDGEVVSGPLALGDPYRISYQFRWMPAGWTALNSSLESEKGVLVGWELDGVAGQHKIPKGRGLTSISITPNGRYIALSVDQSTSLFSLKSAVYVLDSRDGREVFRRYFPSYNRAKVAFLGDRYLAFDFSDAGQRVIEVLEVLSP